MLQAAAPFSTTPIPAHAELPHHEAYSHVYAGLQMLDAMMICYERTGDYEDSTMVLMKGFREMIERNFAYALDCLNAEHMNKGDEA